MPDIPILPADIATFRKDGVAVLRGVLSGGWVARLAEAVAENLAHPGPYGKNHAEGTSAYFGDYCNFPRITAFREVAENVPACTPTLRSSWPTLALPRRGRVPVCLVSRAFRGRAWCFRFHLGPAVYPLLFVRGNRQCFPR